jgi:nucleotide-binding universal stress UspA family protein
MEFNFTLILNDRAGDKVMYSTIMVPVDLEHAATMEKAIRTAADIGKLYHSKVILVGVVSSAPSSVAHNPEEFAQKLDQFTQSHTEQFGYPMESKAVTCNDPVAELDRALEKVGNEVGADLVVMASHVPGFMNHLFHANASHLAEHEHISVFIVR